MDESLGGSRRWKSILHTWYRSLRASKQALEAAKARLGIAWPLADLTGLLLGKSTSVTDPPSGVSSVLNLGRSCVYLRSQTATFSNVSALEINQ